MAEELNISEEVTRVNRAKIYRELTPQIEALISGESNLVANLSNVAAALKSTFGFLWVGFYWKDSETELVLGPFQGPIACTRIRKGKGVCGSSWEQAKTLIIENVDEFPGHIACSSDSKSEIVIPIFNGSEVVGVLDVDADKLNDFGNDDALALEKICQLISKTL